jgi:hypothetical protein
MPCSAAPRPTWATLALAPLALLTACGGGVGQVEVTAWAEETVIEGIATDDGWQVDFDHWVTGFGEIVLSSVDKGDAVAEAEGPWVADWAQAGALLPVTTIDEVPADRHDFGFSTHVVLSSSTPVNDVPADVLEVMLNEGYAQHIAGVATKGDQSVAFSWGFPTAVSYGPCANGQDGTDGVAVNEDEATEAQIWFHADHLLWDQLGTEEAGLAFDAIAAADADGDGTVTTDELEAVDVVAAGYETAGVDVADLFDFITFSVSQMAHLNGGGGCTARGYEGGHDHDH